MKINIALTAVGVSLLLTVFFRTNKLNWGFYLNNAPILLAMISLALITYRLNGRAAVEKGFQVGQAMAISFTPVMILMFLTMGQAMVLLAQYKPQIAAFMAGKYGLHGTLVAAGVMPGSITGLPIVKEMWYEGLSKSCLILFLLTSPLINWQMFFFKLPMLGWKLTTIQFLYSLACSAVLAALLWLLPVLIRVFR